MNVDADVAAIQKTAAENAAATNRSGREGAQGYASFALPDARWMPPDAPTVIGRPAIAEFAAPFTEVPGFKMSWEHPHVTVAGSRDIAYSIGTYSGSGQDPKGNIVEFKGKLLNVWHRQPDESWKIAVAIWNTDEPVSAS